MGSKLGVTAGVVVVVLALAGSAYAAVRTAAVSLLAPYQPPSLSAVTPVVDTEPYLDTASISYDDVAGAVTGSMSLYDSSYWVNQSTRFDNWTLTMTLATDCITGSDNGLTDASDAIELGFAMGPSDEDTGAYTSAWTGATLTGYEGQVSGTGTFDGTNYSGTLQSAAFANLDLRCVDFNVLDNDIRSDGANDYDSGWEWIPGYAPLPTLLNPWSGKFSVRPVMIGLSGDGSNFLAGARQHGRQTASNPGWAGKISWSSWTMTQAVGSGGDWQDNCKPDCAGGSYYVRPAKIRAYDPQNGRFTRLRTRIRYKGKWTTYTWKLVHSDGSWYW
jgi:hypothetical protein